MKSDWRTYTVQELIDEGMLDEPLDGNHGSIHPKASDYVSSGVPFIMANNLVNGKVDYANCAFITETQASTLRKGFAKPGDVLLTHKATIGRTAIVDDEYETIILTPQVTYYRVKKGISNRYLKYYFDSSVFQKLFSNWAGAGSTRAYLGITAQRKLPIVLPPYDVQLKIAKCCGALDDKIYHNQQINDNLQRQLRTIFKAEFTDNSELEKMTQIPLSELCHVVTKGTTPTTLGKPFVESGIIFIKAESILADHSLDKSKFAFIDEETNALLKRSVIHAGDIVFTIAGTLGRFALIDDNALPANTNQAVAIIRADAEKVLPEYIYTCFIGEWHTDYYAKRVQQAVQANLSLTTIKSLPIPVLDKAKMDEYLRLILPLIKAIKGNEAQNEKLAALRDALLPKLMSGEIDVSAVQL